MLINKKNISILILLIFGLFIAAPVLADDDEGNFNPNYIISNSDILDSTSMTLDEIQSFLDEKNGFIANYSTESADGTIKKASEIIYDAAVNNYDCTGIEMSEKPSIAEKSYKCSPIHINPKFLLVLLQKEQGLIEDSAPEQGALDWAMGYGCPDKGGCNDHWKGFGKQVNSASLQFFDYVANPNDYVYRAGNLYTFLNRYATDDKKKQTLVTPNNNATAALYNYTPHVYNGNYNFYKIWNKYFSRTLIEGSLVQIEGEAGVWLIQNDKKRPFLSKSALTSRYNSSRIITISKTDLESYTKGDPIIFPQYSLVRSPDKVIYLIINDKKHRVVNEIAMSQIGFRSEEIIDATWPDIYAYNEGKAINEDSSYPTGALLQDKTTGGVYWVQDGEKSPIWDAVFLKTKFTDREIIAADTEQLNKYITIDPVLFEDGELLKSSDSMSVFVISDGKKRPFLSGAIFEKLGYKWENIITVSSKVLYLYEEGEAIT